MLTCYVEIVLIFLYILKLFVISFVSEWVNKCDYTLCCRRGGPAHLLSSSVNVAH